MSKIIGQKTLQHTLNTRKLPRFFMLHGERGCEEQLICKKLCEDNNIIFHKVEGYGIDNIRDLLCTSVEGTQQVMFFLDGDKLTIQGQNALLKILEEPPSTVYLVITLTDLNNVLETIRSRAVVFTMDNYSIEELQESFHYYNLEKTHMSEIVNIATTPGQVVEYYVNDFEKLYSYVEKVYNNILKVSTGNAFKIGNKIEFKDGDGIPLNLFLETYRHYVKQQQGDEYVNNQMILYTSEALRDLKVRGANKPLIFDIWVLNIRTLR